MRYGENLLRRGDRWFFRCRIRSDLVNVVGRQEMVYSLKTSDRNVARYLCAAIRAGFFSYWQKVKEMALSGKAPSVISEQLKQKFEAELNAAFRQYSQHFADSDYDPLLQREAEEQTISILTHDAARRDMSFFMEAAVEMLRRHGCVVSEHDQIARVLSCNMAESAAAMAEARARWVDGDESFRPEFPSLPETLFASCDAAEASSKPPATPKWKPLTADQLLTGWSRDNTSDLKAIYERKRILQRLCETVGKEDITAITADDIIRWKDIRMSSTTRSGKPISPLTVIQEINLLSALWKWGKANRKLTFDVNPFSGIAPKAPKKAGTSVRPYTTAEAARILSYARSCQKPMQRWLPWVLAYTGARLGEVLYSRKEDVREVRDVMVLDISPDRDRHPKTPWSVRMIPLHPDLIAEGFLDYVTSLPDGSRLFPEAKPDKFDNLSGTVTKTYGNWTRKKLCITDEKINPAHSWRHLFEDHLRYARATADEANALGGHENGASTARSGYGTGLRGMPDLTAPIIQRMPSLLSSS